MTSTTGKTDTTQHPDVSEISDLAEGLLSPPRSAAVRLHLDGCALCADVRDSLEEIRGLLGTLPGPARIPADIAGRIDAALAAEALLQATAPETGTPVSRETARTRTEKSSPAADRPAGRPTASGAASTGPGRSSKPRRRRIALLATFGAAFGALALGTGLYLGQSGFQSAQDSAGSLKADQATTSMSSFSGAPVEDRVHALLSSGVSAGQSPKETAPESMAAAAEGTSAPRRTVDATAVPACVLAGTGRTGPVLGHERGNYGGTPAYLLVLPDPADSGRVQAFVLDAACAEQPASDGTPPADLLLSQTYPRS